MDFRHGLPLEYQQNLVLYKHCSRACLRVQHVLRLSVVLIFTHVLLLMQMRKQKHNQVTQLLRISLLVFGPARFQHLCGNSDGLQRRTRQPHGGFLTQAGSHGSW